MEVKNMDAVIQVRPGNNHGKNTGAGAGSELLMYVQLRCRWREG